MLYHFGKTKRLKCLLVANHDDYSVTLWPMGQNSQISSHQPSFRPSLLFDWMPTEIFCLQLNGFIMGLWALKYFKSAEKQNWTKANSYIILNFREILSLMILMENIECKKSAHEPATLWRKFLFAGLLSSSASSLRNFWSSGVLLTLTSTPES